MKEKNRFWRFALFASLLTVMLVGALFLTLWQQLSDLQAQVVLTVLEQYFGYLFMAFFLVFIALLFGLDAIFHVYILPLKRIVDGTTLIFTSNPSYRIKPEGGDDTVNLAEAINSAADKYETLSRDVTQQIHAARKEIEKEKNILAAIMAELPEGVLICNKNGRIILFNREARNIFSGNTTTENSDADGSEMFVGLGRSIFNLIDKETLTHAIDEIETRLREKNAASIASYFIAPVGEKTFFRFETVPVLDREKEMTGFILIFTNITQEITKYKKISEKLKLFTGCLQSPALKEQLREITSDILRSITAQRQFINLQTKEVVSTIQKRSGHRLGIRINVEETLMNRVIFVDTYSFIASFLFMIQNVSAATGEDEFDLKLLSDGEDLMVTLQWEAGEISEDQFKNWLHCDVATSGMRLPFTLQDIIRQHNAGIQLVTQRGETASRAITIRIRTQSDHPGTFIRKSPVVTESRPEFYDFDLFDMGKEEIRLSGTSLETITYTAFDTETTGLNPDQGDEIISIGAVRIVNNKIQYAETFERLIDPGMEVPYDSYRIHGISTEMVKGKPPIEKVLPEFKKFAEDTVLVGHNLAFDMKMLKLKEKQTRITFDNPILDTLLLSASLHAVNKRHNLEDIANRLGVNIMGRHSALGDAIAAAEIFLKLIPLLNKKGIVTLKDAIAASKNSYYARLKY